MSTELFTGLGLFVLRNVLDRETCAGIRAEMARAAADTSTIVRRPAQVVIDEEHRRSKAAAVAPASREHITGVLEGVRPRVAEHFARPLSRTEYPQFLIYEPGGFFRAHVDAADGAPFMLLRKISVVVFLEAAHRGGALVLYGLLPSDLMLGLPFAAEEGTLLAFPSDLYHEVQTVEEGRRFTIVSWFLHGEEDPGA